MPRFRFGVGALVAVGCGLVLLGYPLLASFRDAGIPGWQPVNGAVAAALETLPGIASQAESVGPGGKERMPEPSVRSDGEAKPSAVREAIALPGGRNASETGDNAGPAAPPAPGRAPAADAEEARLDLNRATQAELERLPGIGPAKARAVIAYRQARPAGFGAVGELLEVKGIGPKIYAEISELVTVNQH